MVIRPKIRGPVKEQLEQIQEEYDYPSTQEAIRHALREAGYDV